MMTKIKAWLRVWIKRKFDLYDIEDLVIGGNCGCCGKRIPNEIFEEFFSWGLCEECIAEAEEE